MIQRHTISKLLFELQLPSAGRAFEMQQALSNYCKDVLPAFLATWMDHCAGEKELLRINRLEIDLGICTWNQLSNELAELVVAALNRQYGHLPQAAQSISTGIECRSLSTGYFEYWLFYLENGFLPSSANIADHEAYENAILETIATESAAVEQCRTLLLRSPSALERLVLQFNPVFLQSWAGAFYGGEAKQVFMLVEEWMHLLTDTSFRILVHEKINVELANTLRGIRYSDVLVTTITTLLQPQDKAIAVALVEALAAKSFSTSSQPQWKQALKQVLPVYTKVLPVLKLVVDEATWLPAEFGDLPSQTYAKSKEDTLREEPPVIAKDSTGKVLDESRDPRLSEQGTTYKEVSKKNDTSPGIAFSDPLYGNEIENDNEKTKVDKLSDQTNIETSKLNSDTPIDETADTALKVNGSGIDNSGDSKEDNKIFQGAATKIQEDLFDPGNAKLTLEERFRLFKAKLDIQAAGKRSFSEEPSVKKPAEGATMYVSNAGLVLLNPFIYTFFESLHLIEDKQFKNDESRDKAVQLLAFLAHGETGLHDHELVLPKLLCGMAPHQPVDRFITLSDAEKYEATELLNAVLEHWEVLPNTSPDGLRVNFLLREGKLDFKNDQWNLQVTQQVYDMLLDKLPWGFGMIKLPWMPWILTTLWV